MKKSSADQNGFSGERLDHLAEFLKSGYVETRQLAGFSLLISRAGTEVARFMAGHADIERRKPIENDTIFRIYSMTKPVTSIALMMLVEDGVISLDDPVKKYIPAWSELHMLPDGSADLSQAIPAPDMLVVDLMRHTSGLTSCFQRGSPVDDIYRQHNIDTRVRGGTLAHTIEQLAQVPLRFAPQTKWNYSIATDVIGYLIEQLSGRTLSAFFEERVFSPLGMTDTTFELPKDKVQRFAALYRTAPGKGLELIDDPATSDYLIPATQYSGGGGLVSTLDDYHRFCRMLLNGGTLDGRRIIGRKTLELMTANHLPGGVDLDTLAVSSFAETLFKGVGFGLGFATTLDPVQCLLQGNAGDFFWGGAAGTYFWVDPAEELIVIFMTQLYPHLPRIRRELRTLVYAAMT
jgi:CubicO group peptidase (beta-lactamase class C family)